MTTVDSDALVTTGRWQEPVAKGGRYA